MSFNICTVWKVSKYGVFSGPYFPVFGLNTEIHGVNLRIQPENRKIRTRKNSVFGLFSSNVGGKRVRVSCLQIPGTSYSKLGKWNWLLRREGRPVFFWKLKANTQILEKKYPDYVFPWVKFSIQNVLRVSMRKISKIFPSGFFFFLLFLTKCF